MGKTGRVFAKAGCLAVLALIVGSRSSLAQKPDEPPPTQQDQQTAQDPNVNPKPTPTDTPGPPADSTTQGGQTPGSNTPLPAGSMVGAFRDLGFAREVLTERGPIRFGPIFITNASAFFLAGNGLRYNQSSNTIVYGTNEAGVFAANINYAHEGRHTAFVIDYNPQLAVVNGVSINDFSTGSATLGANYLLGHRWSLTIHDTAATSNRRLITGDFLANVDTVSGDTRNNSFINLPTRTISDNLQNSLSYLASPRDRLDFEFDYTYLDSPFAGQSTISHSISGRFGWNHALTRDQALGIFYSAEKRYFSAVFPDTVYQQAGGSYSVTLGPTLQIHGLLGIGRAVDNLNGESWTAVGELGVLKKTQRHIFTLGYYRGTSILPVQSNQFVDRIDAGDAYQISNRWILHGAVGNQRSGGGTIETLSGTYATAQATFRITQLLSWLTSYSHIWQPGHVTIPGYSYFSTGFQFRASRGPGGL